MRNKVFLKFLIGLLLVNLEFIMYNTFEIFSVVPVVIIFHFIYLVIITNRWRTESTYSLYAMGLILSYIYSLYANVNAIYYILITIFLIWYSRTRLMENRGIELFIKVIKMYVFIFAVRSFIFVIMYNINIDLKTVIVINTLSSAIINSIIVFIFLLKFQTRNEKEEDHN